MTLQATAAFTPTRTRSRRVLWIFPILGLVGSIVFMVMWPGYRRAKLDRTTLDGITRLDAALTLYASRTGRFPESREGLQPLVDLGVIDRLPVDAWSHLYHYELVGGRPLITSYGSDGLPGGTGEAADVSNFRSGIAH